jgi:hypothetical protein
MQEGKLLQFFQIRPDFWSYIAGRFWYSKRPNEGKPISEIFVSFCISYPTPLILLELKVMVKIQRHAHSGIF